MSQKRGNPQIYQQKMWKSFVYIFVRNVFMQTFFYFVNIKTKTNFRLTVHKYYTASNA